MQPSTTTERAARVWTLFVNMARADDNSIPPARLSSTGPHMATELEESTADTLMGWTVHVIFLLYNMYVLLLQNY